MIKVNPFSNTSSISFKQANVNVMAFSDTHGDVKKVVPLYQNFDDNSKDIFKKQDEKSTLNLMAVVGDWFMNPNQGGYLTFPNKKSGDFQAMFLNSFIQNVRKKVPNLKVLYTPGNHCLDGGADVLMDKTRGIDMETVISNANLDEASLLKDMAPEQRKRINNCKVLEVQDDKNPNLKHKVLVLGIVPINIDYLVKEDVKGLNFVGTKSCKEADLQESDTVETAEAIKPIVEQFRKENPKGAVMLMCHSGEPVSVAISKQVPGIDLVLNAHDHLDKVTPVHNSDGSITKIVSLSQNSQKLENVRLHFDDNGALSIFAKPLYTDFNKISTSNPLAKLYSKCFEKDLAPMLTINDPLGRKALDIDNVRYENNDLANFCTDAIFSEIKKSQPDLNAFIMPSTAFRESLPTSADRAVNNLNTINFLKGIAGSLSNIMVGNIKGEALASYTFENVLDNLKKPTRNAINQPSGLIINRAAIEQMVKDKDGDNNYSMDEVCKFIKIRNEDGEFETINPDKSYTLALPKKLFAKSTNEMFKNEGEHFTNTNKPLSDFFKDFIKHNNGEATLDLENRILT